MATTAHHSSTARSAGAVGLLIAACLAAPTGYAQDAAVQTGANPPSDSAPLDEEALEDDLVIVITGSRTEKRLADTPVATEVLTRDDIEQAGAENVAELLEERAGVQIVRSFSGASVQMQGLGSEYVLILVDGQRVNGRIGGAVDLERFSVERIEQVEIVRGASSALYGADALGGVINIITRDADDPLSAEATVKAGASPAADGVDGVDARGSVASRKGWVSGRLSGSWHDFAAYDLDPSDEATTGSARTNQDVTGQATLRLSDTFQLGFQGDYVRRRLEGIDVSASGATFDRLNVSEYAMFSARPELKFANGARLTTLLGYSLFRDQYLTDQRGDDALDVYEQTLEQTGELKLQLDLPLLNSEHLLTLGAEGFFEQLEADRLDTTGERARGTLLVQDDWIPSEQWELVAGLRLDADSQFGFYPAPSLAVRFDPTDAWTLRTSVGRGYRAPSFRELLLRFENASVNYVVEGNPELQPETSIGVNVGAEWRPIQQLDASVNLFYNTIDDLIATATVEDAALGNPTRFSYVNIDQAVTRGVESSLRARPWSGGSLEAAHTLLDARDLALDRQLEGRSRHRVSLQVAQRVHAIGLEASARGAFNSAQPYYLDSDGDGTEELTLADPYVTLDARLAGDLGDNVTLFVGGENLLDAGDPQFLPLRPRRFYAGLSGSY